MVPRFIAPDSPAAHDIKEYSSRCGRTLYNRYSDSDSIQGDFSNTPFGEFSNVKEKSLGDFSNDPRVW